MNRLQSIGARVGVFGFFVLMMWTSARGEIRQVRAIDLKSGLDSGTVHLTVEPGFNGDSTKPFDGNPFTEMAILGGDSVRLTLSFDTLVTVEKSKVFLWNNGTWKVESADSLGDLESRSGSYRLLIDTNTYAAFAWDSVSFSARDLRVIRLTARNSGGSGVYLGEWTLEQSVTFTRFLVYPYPLQIIPGATLKLQVKIMDDRGRVYPNFLHEPLTWISDNPAVARFDIEGVLSGISVGTARITVATDSRSLTGGSTANVLADFKPEKVPPMTIKVALVLQDPPLPTGNHIHEEFNWRDPRVLATDLVAHFKAATDSVVNFEFVEKIEAARLFTIMNGTYLTITQYVQLLKEPGWTTLRAASDSGKISFDYRAMVTYYGFDQKRNNGDIDEVWVFAAPFLGMYESQLMGPKAFWWNSPPIRDGTALTKLLSVMGLNYERGVDQAFHSFGHRVESAMAKAYQDAQGRNWDSKSQDPTPWDLFTRYDKDVPGQAHVGNIHFPPNGMSDYDYGNTRMVTSRAENWFRYPYLFDQTSQVNVTTWYYTPGDPLAEGQDHLGFLRWWYNHLPRYTGVTDGVLNNWWNYVVDYEGAVDLAGKTPVAGLPTVGGTPGESYLLDQNYPNPFNPITSIKYSVGGSRDSGPGTRKTMLVVYDVLGRQIATLVNEDQAPGTYEVHFDGSRLASGVYFYRLTAGSFAASRKMLLIK
jgi:hypothetical protein